VGIAAYQASGQCVFANNALAQMIGGPRQQVEQHDFRQLAAWRTSGLLHLAETALKTGEPKTAEFRFTTSFGKKVILDAHLVPFRSSGEPHLLAMFHDLTQRRTLERQILDISDREQARIGQDIHDGLCQMLITAGFDINMLAQDLAGESSTAADRARRLAALLDTMIVEARHVSRGLYPVKLEENGLASALHELAAGVSRRSKIHCVAQCPKPVVVTDNAANTHLFRVAQEAVNNALKHAQARRILIRLSAAPAQIQLTVTDDGWGIPAEPNDTAGMGLHIMAYRARALGGTLKIRPGTGGGTVISCCVRLRKL